MRIPILCKDPCPANDGQQGCYCTLRPGHDGQHHNAAAIVPWWGGGMPSDLMSCDEMMTPYWDDDEVEVYDESSP